MDIRPGAPGAEERAQEDREESPKHPRTAAASFHCGGSPPHQTRYHGTRLKGFLLNANK